MRMVIAAQVFVLAKWLVKLQNLDPRRGCGKGLTTSSAESCGRIMWCRSSSCPIKRHPILKTTDIKLVTWAGVRGYCPPTMLFVKLPVMLSTLGMARNATFAVKSTVPFENLC